MGSNGVIQTSARVVFNDRGVVRLFNRAITAGMAAAVDYYVDKVNNRLSRIGHAPPRQKGTKRAGKLRPVYERIRRGEAILRRAGSLVGGSFFDGLSARNAAAVRTALRVRAEGGLIDPPGGSPRERSGRLKQSIRADRIDPETIAVGSDAPYAAIHEFGGTVNVSPWGRGPKREIRIPARPYFRPVLAESRAEITATFERIFEETMNNQPGGARK